MTNLATEPTLAHVNANLQWIIPATIIFTTVSVVFCLAMSYRNLLPGTRFYEVWLYAASNPERVFTATGLFWGEWGIKCFIAGVALLGALGIAGQLGL